MKTRIILSLMVVLMPLSLGAFPYNVKFGLKGSTNAPDKVVVQNITKGTEVTVNSGLALSLVSTPTSIVKDKNEESTLRFYPSPMTDVSTLEFYVNSPGEAIIKILDITGKLQLLYTTRVNQGVNSFSVSGVAHGVNVIQVETEEQIVSQKFISTLQGGTPFITRSQRTFSSTTTVLKSTGDPVVETIEMEYSDGDVLRLTAYLGTEVSYREEVITQDQTLDFYLGINNVYCKVNGTGDGSDWNNATTLGAALAMNLNDGDCIHIAVGTYLPSVTVTTGDATDTKDYTFEIKKNIVLAGGYPSDAMDGAVCDPEMNPTILSGQLDDATNVYRVVTIGAPKSISNHVYLHGLTICDGYGSKDEKITINGVEYARNFGAGIAGFNTKFELSECTITNNNGYAWGGGIYAHTGCEVSLQKCKIINNLGNNNGQGLYTFDAAVIINECTISGNVTAGVAGGIQAYGGTIEVYNSTISNNTGGSYAGGIYIRNNCIGTMVNCTLYGNKCKTRGSAIYHYAGGVSHIVNTTITQNIGPSAVDNHNNSNVINLYNTIISGNKTADETPLVADFANYGGSTIHQENVILSDKVYNALGAEVAGVTFDYATMLGALQDNGGNTKTCLLTGTNNPAVDHGMTDMDIEAICVPLNVPQTVYSRDQHGVSRSGKTSIGAVVK